MAMNKEQMEYILNSLGVNYELNSDTPGIFTDSNSIIDFTETLLPSEFFEKIDSNRNYTYETSDYWENKFEYLDETKNLINRSSVIKKINDFSTNKITKTFASAA